MPLLKTRIRIETEIRIEIEIRIETETRIAIRIEIEIRKKVRIASENVIASTNLKARVVETAKAEMVPLAVPAGTMEKVTVTVLEAMPIDGSLSATCYRWDMGPSAEGPIFLGKIEQRPFARLWTFHG
ncbi:MAG: hypothetical protein ACQETX_07525 [Pseudomonadota bacterium]